MNISMQIGNRTKTKQNVKRSTPICFVCEKSGKIKAFTKNTLMKCHKIMEVRKSKHREIQIPTSCHQEGYHVACFNNFIGIKKCEIEALSNSTQNKQDRSTLATNTDQNPDKIVMPIPIKVPNFKAELDDLDIVQKGLKSEDTTKEYVESTDTSSGSQFSTFATYLEPDISKSVILKSILTRKSPVKREMTQNSLAFTYDFTNQANSNLTIENVQPKIDNVQPNIENVQPNIENVQPNIENVQPNIENVQPNIENVQPNIENVQPNIENVQPNIENVQTNIENVQTNIENIQSTIEIVQPKIENVQPKIENVQPKIIKTTSAEKGVCIFCSKEYRKIGMKKESLIKCDEVIHKKVSLWAKTSSDYELLKKLEIPQPFYHALCKTEYRYNSEKLTRNSWDEEDSAVFKNLHAEAFDSLCAFIKDRIIDKHKTYLLSDLHERYKFLLYEIQNSSTPFNFESLYIQCSPQNLELKIINRYNGIVAISTSKGFKRKVVYKSDLKNFDNSVVENEDLYDKFAFKFRSDVKSMKRTSEMVNDSYVPEKLLKFIGSLIQGPDVRTVNSKDCVKIKSICNDIVSQIVKDD